MDKRHAFGRSYAAIGIHVKRDKQLKVNALIIGAGRSGTTSLFNYLQQHGQVCTSSIKEIPFFSFSQHFQRGEAYFHSFFPDYTGQKTVLTSDTYLLIHRDAQERIKAYNPGIKLLVMLRHPIERAYSAYHYAVNNNYESRAVSFLESFEKEAQYLKNEDIVQKNNFAHFYTGLYYQHLMYWLRFFDRQQILLLKTADLKNAPQDTLCRVLQFLETPPFDFQFITPRHNAASRPKNKQLHRLLTDAEHPLRRWLRKAVPQHLKSRIINSGVVDKVKETNRKSATYHPISVAEKEAVLSYFADDLYHLKQEFGVSWD